MSHDTLIHRLVRPAVRAAAAAGVTPDQLTALRVATGLAAAATFAAGPGAAMDAGAGLFLVSTLLDRADGELARRLGRVSAYGRLLDLWSDGAVTIACFLGLGWGLAPAMGAIAPWLGLVAGAAVAAIFLTLQGSGPAPALLSLGERAVLDPDDAMVLLAPLVWLDLAAPTLVLAATVTPAVALALAWRGARSRQAATAP